MSSWEGEEKARHDGCRPLAFGKSGLGRSNGLCTVAQDADGCVGRGTQLEPSGSLRRSLWRSIFLFIDALYSLGLTRTLAC